MKLRIGFLHSCDELSVRFSGKYSVYNADGVLCGKVIPDKDTAISLVNSIPSEYQWYEKIEIVHDVGKLESYREKYYIDEISTRIIKTGKKVGNSDNFEYWLLKKTSDMNGKIYPSGDYKYKKITLKEASGEICFSDSNYKNRINFIPDNKESSFTVRNVRVGIDFHWDHSEDLEYGGSLEIMINGDGKLTAVNIIDLEEYISSVNSSEMRNDNNIEMLKAQTVAARSTVLATIGKHHFNDGFDLCADDHCQCYQGRKKLSELSIKVAKDTEGEILLFDSRVVDARYSKICGGITERYSACWEDMDFPYLASVQDDASGIEIFTSMSESEADSFIQDNNLDCFCNTLKYELPDSLSFCKDLFRWETEISSSQIEKNLKTKFSTVIGKINDIEVIERSRSGRIVRLEVIGEETSVVIEKELNIRRLMSDTHLPSSAFIIIRDGKNFRLKGAGWGHGVGLCQIGAQIMGQSGYDYRQILKHYYRGTAVRKIGQI